MLAGADPILLALLATGLLLLAGVLLWSVPGRWRAVSTGAHTARARAMAAHPSAAGPGQRTWAERQMAAADVADELAGEGFSCSRPANATVVKASDAGGEYLVNIGRTNVLVAHHTATTYDKLGDFESPYEAVLAVLGHSELRATS